MISRRVSLDALGPALMTADMYALAGEAENDI